MLFENFFPKTKDLTKNSLFQKVNYWEISVYKGFTGFIWWLFLFWKWNVGGEVTTFKKGKKPTYKKLTYVTLGEKDQAT